MTGPVTVHVTESDNTEIISLLNEVVHNQELERITDLATTQEVRDTLGQINAVTTEVADDVAELLNRPEVPDEVKADAEALLARLRDVASAYPPVAPPAPEEPAPGSEPLPGLEEGGTGEVTNGGEPGITGTSGSVNP